MTQSMDNLKNGERLSTEKFKAEYAEGRRDFSYTNLTEINLQGMNLCGIDLRYAVLYKANLLGVVLAVGVTVVLRQMQTDRQSSHPHPPPDSSSAQFAKQPKAVLG